MSQLLNLEWILLPILALFTQGGVVIMVISAIIFLMWAVIFERIYFFRNRSSLIKDSYIQEWRELIKSSKRVHNRYRHFYLSKFRNDLLHNISLIEILILICPLLGLLGTVTGMIDVFDAMSASTDGGARLLAAGVSKATLPTVAGMVAAVSGLLAITVLKNTVEKLNRDFGNKLLLTQVDKSL